MDGNATASAQLNEREYAILKRLAAGRSNRQIADELFLSPHTVKWYNRQIYGKLGVASRAQAIALAQALGLLHASDAQPPLTTPAYQLPAPPTSFIGRSREIADVRRLLARSRLLTLTGTGGTGKTRLALKAAELIAPMFADGVCFVDLAPLTDYALVPKAIAQAIGVFEQPAEPVLDTLKRVLAPQAGLLLLDNFEHVLEAAPLISDLLAAAPRYHVLVTSRESLHLLGEQAYAVPPLSLPSVEPASVENLTASEAGALFLRRARMSLPSFEATDDNAAAIAHICIRLDGLPLAIELAAARCKLLAPEALLERLVRTTDDSTFHVLSGGFRDAPARHRTLRDTLAWSYRLLDTAEQTLFARLAVFRGGCTLEAIEAVCGEDLPIDVFDGMVSLVDKSLVQQKEMPGGEPRFVLLELVHEYARERLEASGERVGLRRRHAQYYVALAERAEPELRLSGYDRWCERFERELDNLRAALDWTAQSPAAEDDLVLGVRLAGALGLFWYGKGHHVEGIRWTQSLLARLDNVPLMYHAKFLLSAGHMAWLYDLDLAQRLFSRALHLSRSLNDTLNTAWSLVFLGYATMDDPAAALPIAEEGLAMFRAMDHRPGIAQALNIIGEVARLGGDDVRAALAYEECLAVCQQTGEARRTGYMYNGLAYIAQHQGDYERAARLGRRELQLAQHRNDRRVMAEALVTIAGAIDPHDTSRPNHRQRAARLLGASEAALERMGAFAQPSDTPEYDRIIANVHAQLDAASFDAAWREGRSMPLDRAVAYALEEPR